MKIFKKIKILRFSNILWDFETLPDLLTDLTDDSFFQTSDPSVFPTSLPVASIIKTNLPDSTYYEHIISPVSTFRPVSDSPSYSLSNNPIYNPPRRIQIPDYGELVSKYINDKPFSRCQFVLLLLCIWGAVSDGVEGRVTKMVYRTGQKTFFCISGWARKFRDTHKFQLNSGRF